MAIQNFNIDDIKNEFKVDLRGRGTSSIRGAARIVGTSDTAILKAFASANLKPSKMAAKLMQLGFSPANQGGWSKDGSLTVSRQLNLLPKDVAI